MSVQDELRYIRHELFDIKELLQQAMNLYSKQSFEPKARDNGIYCPECNHADGLWTKLSTVCASMEEDENGIPCECEHPFHAFKGFQR